MKKLFSVFALALLSTSAMAGTVYMDGNDYGNLPDCNGSVRTSIDNNNTQLNLVFSNVVNCSNFDIVSANGGRVNYPNKKLGGADRARSGSFTIPGSMIDYGSNTIRVQVKSNSGQTSDTIVIRVRARSTQPTPPTGGSHSSISMSSRDSAYMRACGGTIQTTVTGSSYNRQLNLVFRDVVNCSNFDILKSNGDRVNYPNKKLGGLDRSRSGSFTLPQNVIDFGWNSVTVVLKSNSGQTSETIRVNFVAY